MVFNQPAFGTNFLIFNWNQYIVLGSAWFLFSQVGHNGLWLVLAVITGFVLTNLYSVVCPLVNRFWPLPVRFSFSLYLGGIHLVLGALFHKSFVVLLLLNCVWLTLFFTDRPIFYNTNAVVISARGILLIWFFWDCLCHDVENHLSKMFCLLIYFWFLSVISELIWVMVSVFVYLVLKVYYWMGLSTGS